MVGGVKIAIITIILGDHVWDTNIIVKISLPVIESTTNLTPSATFDMRL